jgi:succinyl-diaminopimelate desuccinylase
MSTTSASPADVREDLGFADDAARIAREDGEQTIAFLRDLIRIPSDNPPGDCVAAATRTAQELERLGLTVECHQVARSEEPPVPILIGWLGRRTLTPDLLLNAHLDCSPEGDGWTSNPYGAVRTAGRVHGRGATLSKGDVAAYGFAVGAARRALADVAKGTAAIAITADEGSGGYLGPRHLLEQLQIRPQRAICAGITPQVTIAHNGCVQARLVVRGRAAHTAVVAPTTEAMRLAVALAHRFMTADGELRRRGSRIDGIDSPTLNITRISGGQWFGLAPGRVELWIDRRVTPEEDVQAALGEVRDLVETFERENETAVEIELAMLAEPLRPSPTQRPLARLVQREAVAVLGTEVPLHGVPLYTDARWFGAYGVPTVMYGAGAADLVDAGVNGADENVHEADVVRATEVVARVTSRVLYGGGAP